MQSSGAVTNANLVCAGPILRVTQDSSLVDLVFKLKTPKSRGA
jgi:hypothetical protein